MHVAFILAASYRDQIERVWMDDTFAGIHRLGWFDYALLIPYFALLLVVSFYGLHRYEILRAFRRNRTRLPAGPASRFERLPRITIQLPIYNERFVVERLIDEAAQIDYPRELLQIQVLDDSTDETRAVAERLVGEHRSRGVPIDYIHRTHREGYKAGALENGLKTATGELVAVFDADFLVPRDFLRRTVDYFTDPEVGVVQARWSYLNRGYSMLTEVQAMLLDGHFMLEQTARCGGGLFFNFNGTAGVLRRQMIEDAGGWQHDTLTEDTDLSYRAQMKGWKFVYVPDLECPSELPVDTYGFQVQQFRWAKGLTQVACKLLRRILKSELPVRAKLEAFCHLTPNISYPLMVLITALMLPVMIVRFYMGWQELLMIDVPLLVANFASLIIFYSYAQRVRDRAGWMRSIALMPALIAAGVALTVINTRAVLEALSGVKTGFVRTPKYAINAATNARERSAKIRYRRRSGWLPYVELAMGTYFLLMVLYAVDTYNFLAVPLLAIFVAGYYWAALSTLHQEYRDRLAWQRSRKLELESIR